MQTYRRTSSAENAVALERKAYSAQETAQILGLSSKTIYRLCARGKLRRCPGLRTLLIPKEAVDAFLQQSRTQ